MINLVVEEYCQECLDFTADVEKLKFTADNLDEPGEDLVGVCTTVRCKNRNRCRAIMRFLKKNCENDLESSNGSPTDERR